MHTYMKATAATVAGAALTFSVALATELPASAATGCSTTFGQYHSVRVGSTGSQAKAAQCLLRSAGYWVRVDGSFSAADSAKLRKFQRSHDVNVTGKVYASSWTALLSRGSRTTLHRGDRGAAVKRLQRSLTATGRRVPVTGFYGPITTNAVRSVQRARHLSVTGVANRSVWATLQAGDAITANYSAPPVKKAPRYRSPSGRGARALAFARRQLGDRYVFGANGPSTWDCSGLTQGAWRAAGVSLPHSARQQFSRGKWVSKSNLRPGDLVFYYSGISHVGIYAGNGRVIHAPRPGRSVSYTNLNAMPYKGARRPG